MKHDSRRRTRFVWRGLLCLAIAALTIPTHGAEVMVFAAASLTDALKQVAATYEKQSSDKIIFNFGASSLLERQIEQGAPTDIFFSADEAKMNALQTKGLIDRSTRKSRLGNALVVVVPDSASLEITSASSLTNARVKRLALADPKAVPAGIYAKEWLEKQHVWTAIKPKVIPTENVRAALAAVESGNVEAGVVYKTDAAISRKVKIVYEVPTADGPNIRYPVAVVKESKQPAAAKRFLNYLSSEEAGQVFRRFGFIPLE